MTESKVDLRQVESALRRLQLAGGDLAKVFRAARKEFRADMRAHAKDQQGFDGRWKPLAASTQRQRRARPNKQGHRRTRKQKPRRFRVLGRLPSAFKIEVTKKSIRGVSRVPWSGVHQLGGRAGKGARIPSRPFLWVSTHLLGIVRDKAVAYMATEFRPT